jgi:hypothetical protein
MGNTYGLKIKNIRNDHILKDLVVSNNEKIVEYVYYITRINKFFIENFEKKSLIKEFTLFNIFNKKEYNIATEVVESGYFFDGLEYKCEEIQKIGCFLLVTNVMESSCAFEKISSGESILLGDSYKYYNCFKDVENAIKNQKAKFIFYDIVKRIIVEIDFGDTNGLGIEIIEIDERYVNQLIDDKKILNENRNILFDIEDKDKSAETVDEEINIESGYIIQADVEILNENNTIYSEENQYLNNDTDKSISPPVQETIYILITKYNLSNTHLSISLLDKNTIKHN